MITDRVLGDVTPFVEPAPRVSVVGSRPGVAPGSVSLTGGLCTARKVVTHALHHAHHMCTEHTSALITAEQASSDVSPISPAGLSQWQRPGWFSCNRSWLHGAAIDHIRCPWTTWFAPRKVSQISDPVF